MDNLIKIITFANEGIKNSGKDVMTYMDDSEADHGDGIQVGREGTYKEVIKECARLIIESVD